MTRRRWTLIAAMLLALTPAGCGSYTPEGIYGYRKARNDEVRFQFRPRRYPWTTFTATGDSVPLRELRVRRVSLELVYEDGSRERIQLSKEEGNFERRVRTQRFRERKLLGFAFLVNDRFLASPPREATNRIEPDSPGAPVLLRLALPSTP